MYEKTKTGFGANDLASDENIL